MIAGEQMSRDIIRITISVATPAEGMEGAVWMYRVV